MQISGSSALVHSLFRQSLLHLYLLHVLYGHLLFTTDKNKEEIMEESGLYVLMKSLSDIESGDDELFKAVKYLLQLCTSKL